MDFDIQNPVPFVCVPDHLYEPRNAAIALKRANSWRAAWAAHPLDIQGCLTGTARDPTDVMFVAFAFLHLRLAFFVQEHVWRNATFPLSLHPHQSVCAVLFLMAWTLSCALLSALLLQRAFRAARMHAQKHGEVQQALQHPVISANDAIAMCIEQYNDLATELNRLMMYQIAPPFSRNDASRPFLSKMAEIRAEVGLCLTIQQTYPKCVVGTAPLSSLLRQMDTLLTEQTLLLQEQAMAA